MHSVCFPAGKSKPAAVWLNQKSQGDLFLTACRRRIVFQVQGFWNRNSRGSGAIHKRMFVMIKGETLSHYIRKISGAWKHFILAVRPASFYHRGLATRLASIERFLMLCVSKVRKKIFLRKKFSWSNPWFVQHGFFAEKILFIGRGAQPRSYYF